jgi:hypothetical protein
LSFYRDDQKDRINKSPAPGFRKRHDHRARLLPVLGNS